MDCAACGSQASPEPLPRWKAPFLFVAALLFCPCHLPVTFALVSAVGVGLTGASWLFANRAIVYGAFGLVYLTTLMLLVRWLAHRRDLERLFEARHARHAPEA